MFIFLAHPVLQVSERTVCCLLILLYSPKEKLVVLNKFANTQLAIFTILFIQFLNVKTLNSANMIQ